jgi:hypothetical protein
MSHTRISWRLIDTEHLRQKRCVRSAAVTVVMGAASPRWLHSDHHLTVGLTSGADRSDHTTRRGPRCAAANPQPRRAAVSRRDACKITRRTRPCMAAPDRSHVLDRAGTLFSACFSVSCPDGGRRRAGERCWGWAPRCRRWVRCPARPCRGCRPAVHWRRHAHFCVSHRFIEHLPGAARLRGPGMTCY